MPLEHKRKVILHFFQDDATGAFGLAHANTNQNVQADEGFNAFWDGRGLFHDCFEHAHEFSPGFEGENALNVGGEMAAMGAMFYYVDVMNLYSRLFNQNRLVGETMRNETFYMLQEAVHDGGCCYGSTLNCGLDYQRKTDNDEFEYHLEEYVKKARALRVKESKYPDDMERMREYHKSISAKKIRNLHRWGYRDAEKLIPFGLYSNQEKLRNFIIHFDNFCKANDAEQMSSLYKGFEFNLFHDGKEIVWEMKTIAINWFGEEAPSEICFSSEQIEGLSLLTPRNHMP